MSLAISVPPDVEAPPEPVVGAAPRVSWHRPRCCYDYQLYCVVFWVVLIAAAIALVIGFPYEVLVVRRTALPLAR